MSNFAFYDTRSPHYQQRTCSSSRQQNAGWRRSGHWRGVSVVFLAKISYLGGTLSFMAEENETERAGFVGMGESFSSVVILFLRT